jgi:hypothetical protein
MQPLHSPRGSRLAWCVGPSRCGLMHDWIRQSLGGLSFPDFREGLMTVRDYSQGHFGGDRPV